MALPGVLFANRSRRRSVLLMVLAPEGVTECPAGELCANAEDLAGQGA